MSDPELVGEILRQIDGAISTITRRFEPIRSPQDFLASEAGREKLDAICMQLIALGESVKNLDKITGGKLLALYPEIEWKRVMGMRDILGHHYFDLDVEIVFSVCRTHVGILARVIQRMRDELRGDL